MRKFTKLSNLLCLALAVGMLFSCGKDDVRPAGETGTVKVTVNFGQANDKAATSSGIIPITSWSSIKSMQLFLYDSNDQVKYSGVITVPAAGASSASQSFDDVPVGDYYVAVVANAVGNDYFGNSVATSVDGGSTWVTWTVNNVAAKNVYSQLQFAPAVAGVGAAGGIPAHFIGNEIGGVNYATKTVWKNPGEVFMGYSTGQVSISSVTPASSSVTLKREVAMMRVRIDRDVTKVDGPGNDVSFVEAKSALVYSRVPSKMAIGHLRTGAKYGGDLGSSNATVSVVAGSGTTAFKNIDPATIANHGSSSNTNPGDYIYAASGSSVKILTDDFEFWRDVVIFPNAKRSEVDGISNWDGTDDVVSDASRKYFVIISGQVASATYRYADGTDGASGDPVFWWGTLERVMAPNKIREVNIYLKTKGLPKVPDVIDEGTLNITVNAPLPWDAGIVSEDVIW